MWILIITVVLMIMYRWIESAAVEEERLAVIKEIQQQRQSRVITLIHRKELISILGIPIRGYIDIEDAEALLQVIRRTPSDMPIDMVIHTPGGLALAATQIALALKKHQGPVTVFIPYYAMSGGTLIALAADQIVMDPNAVLGPVDPQLGFFPAASIIEAAQKKSVEDVADYTLILADVAQKAVKQITSLVEELLRGQVPEEKAQEIAAFLASGRFTHDYPIDADLVRSFGIPISTEVPDPIYKLIDLYQEEGFGRPSVNYAPIEKQSDNLQSPH